ncbi:MAG TPA: type I restriction endonuclease, partial [Anaerolineaceae bacterium]|nr:type I restriction endonuclease [Anaerolineaceae bacterium]
MFNEENTVEQMVLDTLCGGVTSNMVTEELASYGGEIKGWRFVSAEELPRQYSDALVESMVRDALIRLNPEIKAQPDRADEVLYRLRTIPLSVQSEGLVRANELFAEWLRGEKSMPFGERGEHTPVRLIDFENLSNNDYVVTNQW